MAHHHRGPLHHLLEESLHLACPEPVVEPEDRLAGGAKAHQIQAINPPAGGGDGMGISPPVATAGGKAMQQHQGWVGRIPQDPPVAALALPAPMGMGPPIGAAGNSPFGSAGPRGVKLGIGTPHGRSSDPFHC